MKVSQTSKILKSLKQNSKRGLTTYDLIQICPAEYRARISELRNDGYNIMAERVYGNGKYLGYFRYHLIEEVDYAD